MIVTCTNCEKKYTVDEKTFSQNTMQFKCRDCNTLFTAEKPVLGYESVAYSEDISLSMEKEGQDRIRFGLYPKSLLLMLLISLVPVGLFFVATYIETGNRVKTG
jgi:methyl-accepting chemotaxis protein